MVRYGTALDYGCGKGKLAEVVPDVACYDPAVERFAAPAKPADVVICRDVMEHVENECIDEVLDHIRSLSRKAAWFAIATRPAKKVLADGRNAHVSIHPSAWWVEKLQSRWNSVETIISDREVIALCE